MPGKISLSDHDEVRRLFPGTSGRAFLDAACVSLAPVVSTRAIEEFLLDALHCPEPSATAQHISMDRRRESARVEAARLIGASAEEIAIVESTTAGLDAIVAALPLEDGDNVLICDLEFLQVAIPFDNARRFKKIEIRPVRHRDGMVTVDDFAARIDSRTRVVAVSSVQWSNGLRLDLGSLSQLARDTGAWLLVDSIQHLGAAAIDTARLGVDVIACGGHKWLNSPFGCGFLYVNSTRLDLLDPVMRGYLTLREPEGGWGTYFSTPGITPFRDYDYVRDARKFETGGTSNYPGAIGLGASLALINDLGPMAIESRIRDLSRYLIEGLKTLGMKIVTPERDEMRAGIVTFLSPGHPAATLTEFLSGERVYVSTRYTAGIGGVRVSVHFFNDREDIDMLLSALSKYLARQPETPAAPSRTPEAGQKNLTV